MTSTDNDMNERLAISQLEFMPEILDYFLTGDRSMLVTAHRKYGFTPNEARTLIATRDILFKYHKESCEQIDEKTD